MDWSLVLLSQGIQSTILASADESNWELQVPAEQLSRAAEAIELYRRENRRWRWRQTVFQSAYLFDWGSLAWVTLLGVLFWLQASAGLEPAGILDSKAVSQGQWWRLFTATWLHADLGHLATNAVLGLILLGFTMGRYGTGLGLLAAYLTAPAGNLASMMLSSGRHLSLGASGMVMGCLGLLAAQFWKAPSGSRVAPKYILSGWLAGIMLFVLLGLSPDSDVLAHGGGFVFGVILGVPLAAFREPAKSRAVDILCGLVFVILTVLPWWLALRSQAAG